MILILNIPKSYCSSCKQSQKSEPSQDTAAAEPNMADRAVRSTLKHSSGRLYTFPENAPYKTKKEENSSDSE